MLRVRVTGCVCVCVPVAALQLQLLLAEPGDRLQLLGPGTEGRMLAEDLLVAFCALSP